MYLEKIIMQLKFFVQDNMILIGRIIIETEREREGEKIVYIRKILQRLLQLKTEIGKNYAA